MQGHSINIPGLDKVPKFPSLLLCMSTCVYKYLYNLCVREQIDNRAYGETGTVLTYNHICYLKIHCMDYTLVFQLFNSTNMYACMQWQYMYKLTKSAFPIMQYS